nr:hypothetical protein GCM10020093_053040 [Planobispora longispora]
MIDQRIRRLNRLGFDVAEMMVRRKAGTGRLIVRPKVVDAGHHQRRLLRLTGLDVEENQARRLLNDLDAFRVAYGLRHEDEAIVAHRWLAEIFQPTIEAVPRELRGKLEPPSSSTRCSTTAGSCRRRPATMWGCRSPSSLM